MKPVYITHAYRSPVGTLMGSLSGLSAPELAIPVIERLLHLYVLVAVWELPWLLRGDDYSSS